MLLVKLTYNEFIPLLVGQITSDPANGVVRVGENITFTCDTGDNAFTPVLLADGQSIQNSVPVTLVNATDRRRAFKITSVPLSDNGVVFTCSNTAGTITLEVQCKCLYVYLIVLH